VREIHVPEEEFHEQARGQWTEEEPMASGSWGVGEHGDEAYGRQKPSQKRRSTF